MNTQLHSGKKEKVNFLVPLELVQRASKVAKEYHFTLSDFFRQALANHVEMLEREKVAREIEEACRFYYETDKKLVAEWEVADAEV